MQASFNVAVKLRDRLQMASVLTDLQKSKAVTSLDHYLAAGEKIIDIDTALGRKIKEFTH